MKRIFYTVLAFYIEIISFLFTVIGIYITYIYFDDKLIASWASAVWWFIYLIIFICLRLRERKFHFISFKSRNDKDAWMGAGIFEYNKSNKAYLVSNSVDGVIFSKCLTWSDYVIKFDFKILNECLGVIIRAVNLSNYIMLQLNQKSQKVRPHIQVNGGWVVIDEDEYKFNENENLSLEAWYKCIISCEKDKIYIQVKKKRKSIFDREWLVPKGKVSFDFRKEEKGTIVTSIPFAITLDYGSVGYRNYDGERALIRNLLIKKL